MRITIVKDDNAVSVDGVRRTVDCSDLPADFHALQWDGKRGEIEYAVVECEHCNGRSKKMNERTLDLAPYQKYIDAWHVEDARVKAQEAEDAARRAEQEANAKAAREALNAAGSQG